jgi:chromosomal replication initiator protein
MAHSFWSQLQQELQDQLDPEEFLTWFRPLKVAAENPESLVLEAPNERFISTLEQSYRPTVNRAIADLKDPSFQVLFALPDGDRVTPRASEPPERESQFSSRYIFDSFVVGGSNQFAYAASRAVAENPAKSYNPLFLYGGVGLGKTHLLNATAHMIEQRHPHLKVMYLAAEQFVNELISSLRFNRMPAFRERYRSVDVWLVDDIQFLANKERTQEEFFHTFNTLYTSQKQIILSSDSPPRDIPTLEERLRSRFEWGLIADIQAPDLETKVAILRRKAESEGVKVPDDVALFIARQVKSNVRELEGMLNRVIAFSSLTAKPLSLDLAQETLRDILPAEDRRLASAEIVKYVAGHYGLKLSEIKSRNNSKQIAFPRQVAMFLCKQLTDLSYPEIGRLFNDKHHSTVMYSVEKIEQLRSTDADFARTLDRFLNHFS